jgi:hypothetical protein
MRVDEGKLRAYLDQTLSSTEQEAVEKYLAQSPEAQTVLGQLQQEQQETAQYLAALAPSSRDYSAPSQALTRLQTHLESQTNKSLTVEMEERISEMFNKSFIKRYQPAIIALTLVMVIAILFSFAPVRAMAGNFLKIFRVQTIQVVPVDAERLEALENNPEFKGLMDQFEPQIEVISEEEEPRPVASLAEAAALVDFPVAEITALPSDLADASSKIEVQEQIVAHLTLDKDLLQAVFEAAEIDITLPDSLNESPLIITKPDTVMQEWRAGDEVLLGFMQLPAPSVEYPDDLDLNALGVAGLQFLGMSKAEATALGATIDWANTLVLPIPSDTELTVSEVSVNGTKGTLFTEEEAKGDDTALMWQQNGMTYFVAGNYTADEILAIAQSVK